MSTAEAITPAAFIGGGASRTWLKAFTIGFTLILALLIWTLWTPVPYGDLTRIGRLSERDFGWRAPPPPAPEHLESVPVDQADILVVGDSFSMTLYWQSHLVKAGYRVATVYWGQFGYLCRDFSDWARGAGFKGKLVIVESIERLLDERMQRGESCPTMLKAPESRSTPFIRPLTTLPENTLNWSAKLTTGLITWRNTRRAKAATTGMQFGKDTLLRMVPDGCSQFSHRVCDRTLFFKEDLDRGPLTQETFGAMERFVASQSLPMLWMVIPNKSTVYLDPNHSEPFRERFRAANYGPDLFAQAQEHRRTVRDFFFPNDTHMSMHGQLSLGETMLEQVRQRLAEPPLRAP